MTVPDIRIQVLNANSVNGAGDFVLYWMIAYRRVRRNFALQRAAQWARERETGIEPATTCLEGTRSPLKTRLIVNPLDSKIGVDFKGMRLPAG